MRRDIVTSAIGIVVLTILLGLVYPLFITGVSQVVFPGNANGQKVYVGGKLVGSKIIGQSFAKPVIGKNGKPEEKEEELVTEPDPRYFQSRPSATEGGAYNAAASTFSNRGPNDKATEEADAENIKAYLELERPLRPRPDRGGACRWTPSTPPLRTSTPKSRKPTPGSRPTASRPCAASRWRRWTGWSPSTPTHAGSASRVSRA